MKRYHILHEKKLPPLLIVLLLMLSLLNALSLNMVRVSAGEYPAIYVDPPSVTDLTPDENFTVSICTDYAGDDVWGWQFHLTYNPYVLHGVNVTNGDLIEDPTMFIPGEFDNEAGELSLTGNFFFFIFEPAPTTSGPGTLANVTFTVVGTGSTNITLGPRTQLKGYTEDGYGDPYTIIDAENMPEHIQHGYFNNIKPIHDVAVISLVAPTTAVLEQLQLLSINVTVANEGSYNESVTVTVSYNTTVIETTVIGARNITPTSGSSETVSFSWNITGLDPGKYMINATATIDVDEDPTDNTKTTQITLNAVHDVAVTSLVPLEPAVIGPPMFINVTVANEGSYNESVTVTVSYKTVYPLPYDTGVIGTKNFTLAKGPTSNTVSLSWDTTGLNKGKYEINATATIATDEDLTDNTKTTQITLALGHDVAIKHISAPTSVDVGELVTIRVLVTNLGGYNETFEVKVTYDNSTIEEPKSVTLLSAASKYIEFSWGTIGVVPDSYTITAKAILDGDVNLNNNLKTKSIDVNLPLGAIAGTVTDASTGDPIEGANVAANSYSDITDADGHYNITDVPAGTYNVTASANGYQTSSQTNITVDAGETPPVNFELTPLLGTIAGTVKDASTGDPIAGANVTANGVSVSTGAEGSYSIKLAPGNYTVTASKDGYESSSKTNVTVTAGYSTTMDFELTPTPAPSGIPWHVYVATGVTVIIVVAVVFYFLKARKPKPPTKT